MAYPWQKPEGSQRGPVLGGKESLARMKESMRNSHRKEPPSPPKPVGFFGKDKEVQWIEARRRALKDRSIPGAGRFYSEQDIDKMLKEDFPDPYLTKERVKRRMDKLASEKKCAKTGDEKLAIDRKIRFYEKRIFE